VNDDADVHGGRHLSGAGGGDHHRGELPAAAECGSCASGLVVFLFIGVAQAGYWEELVVFTRSGLSSACAAEGRRRRCGS